MYGRGYQVRFGPPTTPPIIKQLMIASAGVFVAQVLTGGAGRGLGLLTLWGGVTPYLTFHDFFLWQPFTYMWLHGGLLHIAMNMFVLWMFGSDLALIWGPQRFLRYYLTCGVGAGFVIAGLPWLIALAGFDPGLSMRIPTVGASGAVMGVILAFSFTWPDRTITLLFPPIPFKAIWLIPILFLFEFLGGSPATVSHVGHLGGVLVGWLYLLSEGRTPGAPTVRTLEYRWRRWLMRRKLRAVRDEEDRWRQGGGGGGGGRWTH